MFASTTTTHLPQVLYGVMREQTAITLFTTGLMTHATVNGGSNAAAIRLDDNGLPPDLPGSGHHFLDLPRQ
jgi:hypothetical protein